jgi:hypothetical protein
MLAQTERCTASSVCRCDGSTQLAYRGLAVLPGTGASGKESGMLVASGPAGSVTLLFKGTRTSLGAGHGNVDARKGQGPRRRQARPARCLHTQTNTLHAVTGTMNTVVSINTAYGCWNCAA